VGEVRGGGGGGHLGRRLGRLRPAQDSRDRRDEGGKPKAERQRCNCFHSVGLDGDLAGVEEVDDSSEVLL